MLNVVLYTGVVVDGDAVSNSLKVKLDILESLRARGADVEVAVFTKATDMDHPAVHVVPSVAALLRQDAFWSADIHVFEFGIHYDLFDSVFVIPADRPVLVVDHNVTPPELVDAADARRACELALVQRHNMSRANLVACASEFNRSVCRSIGIEEDRLTVLHLPAMHREEHPGAPAMPDTDRAPVRLFYLGRLVRAKGVPDLLEAVEHLWSGGEDRFTLTLAGNISFSDPAIVDEVRRCVERVGPDRLRLLPSPTREEVLTLLRESQALVMPSYHEGLCVPVIEALTAGCYVIAYDAANLPNVVGGFGSLVPAGDVTALGEAMADVVESWAMGEDSERMRRLRGGRDRTQWLADLEVHLDSYSYEAYEAAFLRLVEGLAVTSPAGLSPATGRAITDRIAELAP